MTEGLGLQPAVEAEEVKGQNQEHIAAQEKAIRDLLRTAQMTSNQTEATEKTIQEIAKQLNRGLNNGSLVAKILAWFKKFTPT